MKLVDGNLAQTHTREDDAEYALQLSATVRDIKNSLGIIVAQLEAGQSGANPGPGDGANGQMQREVQRIDNAVTQLLYNYQLAQGQLQLCCEEVDLRQFAEDLVLDCKHASADTPLRIHCEEQDYPLGYFDRSLVRSVMLSALLAASRYTSDEVVLRIAQRDAIVSLVVSYNGEPYPDELMGGVGRHAQCSPTINSCSPAAIALQFAARVALLHQRDCGDVTLQVGNTDSGGCFSLYLPAA